jgi:RNA polymerase sigma factor (sigma-70 family)
MAGENPSCGTEVSAIIESMVGQYFKDSNRYLKNRFPQLNEQDCEDIFQDGIVKIIKLDIKQISNLYGFLRRVTYRLALDHLRKKKRSGFPGLDNSQEQSCLRIAEIEVDDEDTETSAKAAEIRAALNEVYEMLLSDDEKIIYRSIEGEDSGRGHLLAQRLGITIGAAKTRKSRLLKKLRGIMEELGY